MSLVVAESGEVSTVTVTTEQTAAAEVAAQRQTVVIEDPCETVTVDRLATQSVSVVGSSSVATITAGAPSVITLTESFSFAGGDGTRDYLVSAPVAVPNTGQLYLRVGDVLTSSSAVIIDNPGTLFRSFVRVEQVDGSNDYDLEILVNGTVRLTASMASGNLQGTGQGSYAVAVDDLITVRMFRTAGSGKSDFKRIVAGFTIKE